VRHHDVEDQQIGGILAKGSHGLQAIFDGLDLIALAQREAEELAEIGFILGDQNTPAARLGH
jgi:hypothetical protein